MKPSPEQQAVIDAPDRSILVIAGPGSGKTQTLVNRIAARSPSGDGVVVITFTLAAAAELKQRLAKIVPDFKPLYMGTLHGWCLQFIQQNGTLSGYRQNLIVIDDDDATSILKEVAKTLKYKGSIERLKEFNAAMTTTMPDSQSLENITVLNYRRILKSSNMIDFDMILATALQVLVQTDGRCGIKDLYVDEYQDSGSMDDAIYGAIQCARKFFVGDPDQAIYGFRGGKVENILELAKTAKVFTLEDNYRSVHEICEAAQRLIEHNRNRFKKQTVAQRPESYAAALSVWEFDTAEEELREVVQRLMTRAEFHNCAILCRTNAVAEHYSKTLRAMGMETRAKKDDMPKDWWLVKMLVPFLLKPHDDHFAGKVLAWRNTPEKAAQMRLEATAAGQSINAKWLHVSACPTWKQVLEAIKMDVSPASRDLLAETWNNLPLDANTADITTSMIGADKASHEEGNGVTITTIHGAKGREWDHVYLPAWEQEIFPGKKTGPELEEDRRLAYVAVTRGRDTVWIGSAKSRKNAYTGRPERHERSVFVTEIASS